MSKITLGQAIKKILKFIFTGESNIETHAPVVEQEHYHDTNKYCHKCKSHMNMINKSVNDFMILEIYECPECHSISEYHYDDNDNVLREFHILDADPSNVSLLSELNGVVPYENFSLSRLWNVSGFLCYPMLVKTESNEKPTLIFVKVGTSMEFNNLDGFIIDTNNVIGEVHIIKDQNISYFVNPYLAHLPYPTFSFISVPTTKCDALESVMDIRFKHEVFGHDGFYKHELIIIKDIGLKANGIEVNIHFNTDEDISNNVSMMTILNGIDLKSIVLGKTEIHTQDKFSINSASLYTHNLSSIGKHHISDDMREQFWKDIEMFFMQYDLHSRSEVN